MRDELERIYLEHRQGLYALALSVTRRADLAEDAVHDGMVKLCRAKVEPRGDMVGYVFTSVRNAAIDIIRRAKARHEAPTGEGGSGGGSGGGGDSLFDTRAGDDTEPGAAVADAEQQRRVKAAIDALPDKQREIIVLRLIAGLKFEQIAQTLDLPLGTVTTRYRRTLGQLREQLGG